MTPFSEVSASVRRSVAAAAQRRHRTALGRRFWRIAPAIAATSLLVAAASRWMAWPAAVPLATLGVAAFIGAGYFVAMRRRHAVSDALAAAIDAEAGLGGELRSASWFAEHGTGEAWTDYHVHRASERVRTIEWRHLYPDVRARGARIATAAMTVAALVLALAGPMGQWSRAEARAPAAATNPAANRVVRDTFVIPPELQNQLEALLASAEPSKPDTPGAKAADAADLQELIDLLSRLRDAEALKELARAMDREPDATTAAPAKQMASLADRAKRAAAAAAHPELREALEKLAQDLSQAASDDRLASDEAREAEGVTDPEQPAAAKPGPASDAKALSLQFSEEAASEGSATLMMMTGKGGAAGSAEPGAGPTSGAPFQPGAGKPSDLAQALRHETIEASQDDRGQTVETDMRRMTEQGRATASFTGRAAGSFDRSRASAPPPVPEARRASVRTYFTRKQ